MNEDQLIREVAVLWFANGGDSDGFAYCYPAIKTAVETLEEAAKQEEISHE